MFSIFGSFGAYLQSSVASFLFSVLAFVSVDHVFQTYRVTASSGLWVAQKEQEEQRNQAVAQKQQGNILCEDARTPSRDSWIEITAERC